MKTSMSARRLLSLFAALALVVVVLLSVQARIAASNVVSSPQAAVDQAVARGPRYNPSSPQAAVDRAPARGPRYNPPSAAALAEQTRLEFRHGEWNVDSASIAAASAEQARLEFRRGEWYGGQATTRATTHYGPPGR